MTLHNPIPGNAPGLPVGATIRLPRGVLTPTVWAELHDALTLALDALGDRPEDLDQPALLDCIANQCIALRIANGRLQNEEGAVQ